MKASASSLVERVGFEDIEFPDGQLMAGAIILFKAVDNEGEVVFRMVSAGLNWMERLGMLRQAETIEKDIPMYSAAEEDD